MRISNGMKAGMAVLWLAAAGAAATGCSTTTDGAARCPGCGPGGEPSFPTSKPTVSTPTTPVTPTPTTVPTPGGGQTLSPTDGYVFIETKSGQTRCQLNTETVGCESNFANPPVVNGQPANGVEVTASGSMRWIVGNLGDPPVVALEYATYHAVGWTIEAGSDGTKFTNDGTGHGLFISTEGVKVF